MCQGFENWPPLQRPRAPPSPRPAAVSSPRSGTSRQKCFEAPTAGGAVAPRDSPDATHPAGSESRLGSWEEDSGVLGRGPERVLSPTALITSEPQKHTPLSLGRVTLFRNWSANFRKGPDGRGRGFSRPLSPSALIAGRRTDTKRCGSVPGTPHFPNQESARGAGLPAPAVENPGEGRGPAGREPAGKPRPRRGRD